MALPSRLISIWRTLGASVSTNRGNAGGLNQLQFQILLQRAHAHHVGDVADEAFEVAWRDFRCPASGFDSGQIQQFVDQPRRCSPLRLMMSRSARCFSDAASPRSRLANPRMAFRGVRNSWLMSERKALLARFALLGRIPGPSAESLAVLSSRVRSATSNSSLAAVDRSALMSQLMRGRDQAGK